MTPEQVRDALAGKLPPATLVLGPGAGALVFQVCTDFGWAFRWDLNAEAARQVREEAGMAALRGLRVTALNLEGASGQVQNMLLKVLEEPSPDTRFVLAAERRRPLPTVVSRCRVLVLGADVPQRAPEDPAVCADVGTVIRAARSGQPGQVAQAVRGWWKGVSPGEQPPHLRVLSAWAAEAASGRWTAFRPDYAPGVSPVQALRLLAELGHLQGTRLGPVAALDRVFGPE